MPDSSQSAPRKTECGCEQCQAEPWPTYTRQFFHECEVRTIARWPLEARREHLVKVEKARGLEVANRLREGVKFPEKCKFPMEVPEVILLEAVELLPVSEVARQSIDGVPVWNV